MPAPPLQIAVITGSTREGRFGPVPARWIIAEVDGRDDMTADAIDLAHAGLRPVLPRSPDPDERRYIERIDRADGYVVVTPEYNHSFPGPLKTAIDATSGQLRDKPVGFVAYGGMSGGLRAVEQLRPVLAELHAVGLRDTVSFHGAAGAFDGSGRPREESEKEAAAAVLLDALVWWTCTLRRARDERAVGSPT